MNIKVSITTLFLLILFIPDFVFSEDAIVNNENEDENKEVMQSALNYTSSDLRDPFKSYIPSEKDALSADGSGVAKKEIILPPLEVQGVVWGTSLPMAIIDGKIVRTGDMIKEAKIEEINKDYISLLYEEKLFSIPTTYIENTSSATPTQEE